MIGRDVKQDWKDYWYQMLVLITFFFGSMFLIKLLIEAFIK